MSDYDMDDGDYLYDFDDDRFESPDTADDFDTFTPNRNEKGKQKELEYESLSPEELLISMNSEVQRFMNLSGLDPAIAAILCRYYKWNTDLLLERYMDSPRSVMKSIGEPHVTDGAPPLRKRPRTKESTEFVCGVCFTSPEENNAFKARCFHKFCGDCYQMYVQGKIRSEGQCKVHCMEEKCRVILTDQDLERLCDEDTFARYRELLLEAFVKCSSYLRFCPYPSCKQTVSCKDVTSSSLSIKVPIVQCSDDNNHVFCFGCGVDDDHRPAICKTVSLWLSNARDDAGTTEWLAANTRSCPRCHQSIEKNGGCNRIHCRHCQHQFCWVCNTPWDKHGYNNKSCNAFQEPVRSDPETRAKANLERWLFYFDRWNNHEISAKLDEKLYRTLEDRIQEVQEASNMSWIEARFMKNAVEELSRCRYTLKWTYSMAFYLKSGNAKQIFEDLQANLEKAVEDLSQMLEEEIQQSTVMDLRRRMVDKTVYVKTRQNILLEDAARGLQEGRWEWTIPID